MATKLQAGRVLSLGLDEIQPDPLQPRKAFLEKPLEDLAANIKVRGIKTPIKIRRAAGRDEKPYIIDGERRWRAAAIAGLEAVPCVLDDESDPADLVIDQVVANNLREGLTELEIAGVFARLRDEGRGPTQIVEHLKRHGLEYSRSHVSNTLRLLELPDWAKALLEQGKIGAAHARSILRTKDYPAWEQVARSKIEGNLKEYGEVTVDDVEHCVSDALRSNAARSLDFDANFNWKNVCKGCKHLVTVKTAWGGKSSFCLDVAQFERKNAEAQSKAAEVEKQQANTPVKPAAVDPAQVKPKNIKTNEDGHLDLVKTRLDYKRLDQAKFDTKACDDCPHKRTGVQGIGGQLVGPIEICTLPVHFAKLELAANREVARRERFKEALDEQLLPYLQERVGDPDRATVRLAILAYLAVGEPVSGKKPNINGHIPRVYRSFSMPTLEQRGCSVIWNLTQALEAFHVERAGEDPLRHLIRIALPLLHHEQRRELAHFMGVQLTDFYRPTEDIAKLYRKAELVDVIDPSAKLTGWNPPLNSRPVSELQTMFVEGGTTPPENIVAIWESPIRNIHDDVDELGEGLIRCRYCGCHHMDACDLENGPCRWLDAAVEHLGGDEGVCTNPECVEAFIVEFPAAADAARREIALDDADDDEDFEDDQEDAA